MRERTEQSRLSRLVRLGRFVRRGRLPASFQLRHASTVLQAVLIFTAAFGFHAYLAPYGVDPHHDGIMFKPALDVSQGKMVFRDTFTQYGGLTVLLQAAALKLFGARLIVMKMQTALTYGLAFLVFWRAWSRIVPAWLAALLCVIGSFLGPESIASSLPWSSIFGLLFQALTLLWALRYSERGRASELVLSGAAAACTFWCRQPVGAFLTVGMTGALVLVFSRIAPTRSDSSVSWSAEMLRGSSGFGRVVGTLLLFGSGLVLVNGTILLWLASFGALGDWWKQSIVFAKVWSEQTGQGHSLSFVLDCLFPSGHLRIWCLLAVAVVIQTLRSAAPFLDPSTNLQERGQAHALLASIVALTSWLQYYPVACDYHCYWAGVPMLGVFAHLLYSSHRSPSRTLRSAVVVIASALLFYHDVDRRVRAAKPHIRDLDVPIEGIEALRGMHTNYAEARSYAALAQLIDAYLQKFPEGTIVTSLGEGLFPALTVNQANYHPLYLSWDRFTPLVFPERQQAYLNYVSTEKPMIIGEAHPSTHVHIATLFLWGYSYHIHVPEAMRPTDFLECDGAGVCRHRPF